MPQTTRGSVFMNVLAVISVGCAAAVTWRLFFPPVSEPVPVVEPINPADWVSVSSVGHRLGAERPTVTVVVFADFQCQACRIFARSTLKPLLAEFGDEVAVIVRHWPLERHEFSYLAARAAECAAANGRFHELYDLMFEWQDSLGMAPWMSFAREAGIQDTASFEACVRVTNRVPAIERDIVAAKAIGGIGTPTVLIDGFRYASVPTRAELNRWVDSARRAVR